MAYCSIKQKALSDSRPLSWPNRLSSKRIPLHPTKIHYTKFMSSNCTIDETRPLHRTHLSQFCNFSRIWKMLILVIKLHTECECHQDASFKPLTALIGPACKKLWPLFGFINSRPTDGHLERHLGYDSFLVLCRFLVRYSPPQTVPETVKKTFASNFLGVEPNFYPTNVW